jgi:hypothetical protein
MHLSWRRTLTWMAGWPFTYRYADTMLRAESQRMIPGRLHICEPLWPLWNAVWKGTGTLMVHRFLNFTLNLCNGAEYGA